MSRPALSLVMLSALAITIVACDDRTLDRAAGSFEPSSPGKLTVATADIPSPGFWEGKADDLSGGFEYELAIALQERFGLEDLEVVVVPFARIVSGDLDGADLALSLITPTGEREEVLDFSEPYLRAPPALLVRDGAEVPDLETARELRYAVQQGTTLELVLSQLVDPDSDVEVFASQQAVVAALRDDDVDAAMLDLPAALALAELSGGELTVAAKLGTDATVAAALPAGESGNAEAASSAIRALASDGTLEELSTRWLGAEATEAAASVPLLRSSR